MKQSNKTKQVYRTWKASIPIHVRYISFIRQCTCLDVQYICICSLLMDSNSSFCTYISCLSLLKSAVK